MNIFFLDLDPEKAAVLQCDKHIVKMPLETAQMLCTVYHRYGEQAPYKSTHANHPSTQWAGSSIENYRWLWKHGVALCNEYTHRYGKVHACLNILTIVQCPPVKLVARGFTRMPQAMPDQYKGEDVVQAYREYYKGEKAKIATWRAPREVPVFMKEVTV